MTTLTLERLDYLAARYGACEKARRHLQSCKTAGEAMATDYRQAWAYWLRPRAAAEMTDEEKAMAEEIALEKVYSATWLRCDIALSEETARRAEEIAVRDHDYALVLRRDAPGLSDEAKRLAEAVVCRSPWSALHMRKQVKDLSAEARRLAELRVCENVTLAERLLADVPDLHPDTIAKLADLGIR